MSERLAEAIGADRLEDTAEETGLSDYGSLLRGYDAEGFLGKLLTDCLRAAVSPQILRDLAGIVLTVLLVGSVQSLFPRNGIRPDASSLAAAAAVLALVSGSHDSLLRLAESAILKLQDMANVLLPLLGSAALLSGQVTAAAAKYSAAALFLNLLVNLCCGFILPLIRMYLASAAAEAAAGGGIMSAVTGFLKWCAVTSMTCLMLAFTFYLSLTAMTANTVDAAIVRSAKTALAAMLPVVGSIAGDAASSLLSAAAVIRQSAGVFGLLAVTAILLGPFLQTSLRCFLLKGASMLSSELAEGCVAKLMARLSEAAGMLLACIGSCGLALFFSIYSLIRAVSI